MLDYVIRNGTVVDGVALNVLSVFRNGEVSP